jgi:hypothetical protein
MKLVDLPLALAMAALLRCSPGIPPDSPQGEAAPERSVAPSDSANGSESSRAATLVVVGSSYTAASEILAARGLRDKGFPWDMISPEGSIAHTFDVGHDEALLIHEDKKTGGISSMAIYSNWRKGKAHGKLTSVTEYDTAQ